MASKKVYIDVIVDDKGTTKRVAVDAKALGNQLDKSGASTECASKSQDRLRESTDRASRSTRGAAQTAKSGTKNFANMAAGIQGGLVPAYATLAANIFAITALFDALSRAADFTKLIAGQEALAANTGIAYKTMSNSIKEATGAQISYKDAASAAAIGSAAGLSSDQLTRLGKAAKDTSLVLGRDLTDSFNRLVRGVTKAEPELLDELGIVLRLEPATLKYANSIGKSVKELSAYERSQAVANEVLEQAERKFGDAAAGADTSGESIQRLKSSFDSMLETVQTFLIKGLAPVFDFLANNTASLIAVMSILGSGIISALTPAGPALANVASGAADAEKRIRSLAIDSSKLGRKLADETSKLTKADFEQLKKSAAATTSSVINTAGLTEKEVVRNIELMGLKHDIELAKMQGGWKKYYLSAKASIAATLIESGKLLGTFKLIARGGAFLLRAIPFVGIAVMLFDVVKMLGIGTKELSAAQEKAEESTRKFTEASKLLNEELESTNKKLSANQLALEEAAIAIGNMANSANLLSRIDAFSKLEKDSKGYRDAQKGILQTFDSLAENIPAFGDLKEQFLEGKGSSLEFRNALSTVTSESVSSSHALSRYQDSLDAVAAAQTRLGSGASASPLASLVETMQTAASEFDIGTRNINAAVERTEKEYLKAIDAEQQGSATAADKVTAAGKEQLEILGRLTQARDTLAKGERAGTVGVQDIRRTTVEALEEELRLQKEKVNELIAEKNALKDNVEVALENREAAKKERADREAGKKVFDAQQKVFETANKDIVNSAKERSRLEEEISEKRTLGITIDQKQANLRLGELSDQQKILQAEEAIAAADAVQASLKVDGSKASQAQLDSAKAAVDAAVSGLIVAQNTKALNDQRRALQDKDLDFQRTLNRLKAEELSNTMAINAARLNLQRIEAGLGQEFGFAAARSAASARRELARQNVGGARQQQELAQSVFNETRDKYLVNQASTQEFLRATEQLANAKARTKQAQLQLDIELKKETSLRNQMKTETELLAFETKMQSLHPAQELYNQNVLAYKDAGLLLTKENLAFIEEETLKQQELANTLELKQGLQESISSNITRAFESIADGSMNAKQAFSEMARAMLADLAQLITRAFVLQTLLPSITGGLTTAAATSAPTQAASKAAVPGRDYYVGGTRLQRLRRGGIAEPYSNGGIARGRDAGYPAILHGTEAVVPLPNGREIPVEMVGGASGTNNVSVNISMDNQGGAQQQNTADNNQMRDLGLAISGAVQEELQKQKRPGGILSPYGAA